MAGLKIDFAELRQSASTAEQVANTFSSAERIAGEVAGYTGHDRLASTVRDFGEKWDIARGKLIDNLTFIAEYLRSVVDTFDDLDLNLADAAREVSTAATSDGSTGGSHGGGAAGAGGGGGGGGGR